MGMKKSPRGGRRGGTGRGGTSGVNPKDIVSTTSLISERGNSQELVDDTLSVFEDVYNEYGTIIGDIELATMKGKGNSVLAYYDGENIAVNKSYFNKNIETAYAECVKSGFHPSNGNKTALQATVAHELGHKLTSEVAIKMGKNGWFDFDEVATEIVNQARKNTKHRGVVQMARKISGYATYSNAEAIAEAFSDVFCNGKNAHSESHAIVNVINSYLK